MGKQGEKGVVEISDMLFTTKGNTAGAVLMEWNVHESVQGSAGIWDSIFRVGGAKGSDLDLANCPAKTNQVKQRYFDFYEHIEGLMLIDSVAWLLLSCSI